MLWGCADVMFGSDDGGRVVGSGVEDDFVVVEGKEWTAVVGLVCGCGVAMVFVREVSESESEVFTFQKHFDPLGYEFACVSCLCSHAPIAVRHLI